MDEFGITVKLDGGATLGSLWETLQSDRRIKVISICPTNHEFIPKETVDVSVNSLFNGRVKIARRAKAVRKNHERTEGGGRSIQIVFDMIKHKDGIHWTDVRDKLAKQGYAEGTGSARLNELKSKYHLVEHRDDGLYYLTKRGQKTKIVP